MRNCEAVLYVTSLNAAHTTPADLLAYVRGHWTVEHLTGYATWSGGGPIPPRTGNPPR